MPPLLAAHLELVLVALVAATATSLPLAVAAAKQMADADLRAGEEREPWVLARDAAVLALLYGSGLRISEALGLKRDELPTPGKGDSVTVTGKGNKTRMVPVLQRVLELVADYVALCPFDLPGNGPLFVGTRGGPLSPRIVQLAMARLRGALGLPVRFAIGPASRTTQRWAGRRTMRRSGHR